jgi:hypothetical protein
LTGRLFCLLGLFLNFRKEKLGIMAALNTRRYLIILLAVATGLIHLIILGFLFGGPQILFILNGLGYLALIAALYFVPQLAGMRSLIRWVLIAYTAITIIGYFVMNWPDVWGPLGLITKAIEIVLIILLLMDSPEV